MIDRNQSTDSREPIRSEHVWNEYRVMIDFVVGLQNPLAGISYLTRPDLPILSTAWQHLFESQND